MKESRIIKLNYEFSAVCRRGRIYNGKYLKLFVLKNRYGLKRVGFATSRKFENAVLRNRAKRLLREIYRSVEADVLAGHDLVLLMKAVEEPAYAALGQDLHTVLSKAGLIGR